MARQVKNPPAMQKTQETQVWSLGRENPLTSVISTHSSILAWKSRGQRNLAGISLWGHKQLGMTEGLSAHAVLYHISSVYGEVVLCFTWLWHLNFNLHSLNSTSLPTVGLYLLSWYIDLVMHTVHVSSLNSSVLSSLYI